MLQRGDGQWVRVVLTRHKAPCRRGNRKENKPFKNVMASLYPSRAPKRACQAGFLLSCDRRNHNPTQKPFVGSRSRGRPRPPAPAARGAGLRRRKNSRSPFAAASGIIALVHPPKTFRKTRAKKSGPITAITVLFGITDVFTNPHVSPGFRTNVENHCTSCVCHPAPDPRSA